MLIPGLLMMKMRIINIGCVVLLCSWVCDISWVPAQPFPREGGGQFAPSPSLPQESPFDLPLEGDTPDLLGERPRRRGPLRGDFQQRREERHRRLERARAMVDHLLASPNVSAEVKTKARRLSDVLDKHERLERQLEEKRQAFLRNHQPEIDELRQLQERAERLRSKLRSAREQAMNDNRSDLQEMRRTTQEARDLALELRQQFQEQRRQKRDW